jgi:hypothetical protein
MAEVYRQALEDVGFDGIIDHSVSTRFRGMNRMNLDPDTTHYIVFKPQQIKSANRQQRDLRSRQAEHHR